MTDEILIERNVPIPPGRKISDIGKVANNMEPGDSVGGLTSYYSRKLVMSLNNKGKQAISRKEGKGLRRVWCVGLLP